MKLVQLSTNQECVASFEGSPRPANIFEPHMPSVDLLSDMDALFATVRRELVLADPPLLNQDKGQRYICIITPGRVYLSVPCPGPGSMSPEELDFEIELLPPSRPLNITVITYNLLEAILQNVTDPNVDAETMMGNLGECIPFLGFLLAFSYIGHSVIAFEGHPSAFESGVRNSDVLLVDSGMVPFLQGDWVEVAFQIMRPNGRILFHNRENYTLGEIRRSIEPPSISQYNKPWWKLW